jgi:hypothetical protein
MGVKNESLASFCGVLEKEVLHMMCSLFKGLKEFMVDPPSPAKPTR